jgi:hypothetical protein
MNIFLARFKNLFFFLCNFALILVCVGSSIVGAQRQGHKILIDKVLQKEGQPTEEWMVRTVASAGFSVYSPRYGDLSLSGMTKIARWSKKHGIGYMPWLRGAVDNLQLCSSSEHRYYPGERGSKSLCSPNSSIFWRNFERTILQAALLSKQDESVKGIFLDFENYWHIGAKQYLYDFSYDDIVFNRFLSSIGHKPVRVMQMRRKQWLQSRGLLQRFEKFQLARWYNFALALRRKIELINPAFQIFVYPAPAGKFLQQTLLTAWTNDRNPLVIADPSTYKPTSKIASFKSASDHQLALLKKRQQPFVGSGLPFAYTGGLDPIMEGVSPDLYEEYAKMLLREYDGYWVFYEGVRFESPLHDRYWAAFARANLPGGQARPPQDAGSTQTHWFTKFVDKPALTENVQQFDTIAFPERRVRFDSVLIVRGHPNSNVKFQFTLRPVDEHASELVWDARSVDGTKLHSANLKSIGRYANQDANFRAVSQFGLPADGVAFIGLTAHNVPFALHSCSVPCGYVATEPLHLFSDPRALYFRTIEGSSDVKLKIIANHEETVAYRVYDHNNISRAEGETTRRNIAKIIHINTKRTDGGGVWRIVLMPTHRSRGFFEDHTIQLIDGTSGVLALTPEYAAAF